MIVISYLVQAQAHLAGIRLRNGLRVVRRMCGFSLTRVKLKILVYYASMFILFIVYKVESYYLFYPTGNSKNQTQTTRFRFLDVLRAFPFSENIFIVRIILNSGSQHAIILKSRLPPNLLKNLFVYFGKSQLHHYLSLNDQHTPRRHLSMPLLILLLAMIRY